MIDQYDRANWKMIMAKIAAGDTVWITIGANNFCLMAEANAAADCVFALTDALITNPEAVLAQDTPWSGTYLDTICGYPFFDAEYTYIQTYSRKAIAAVSKVKNPKLKKEKDLCLRFLKEGKAEIDELHRQGRWNE